METIGEILKGKRAERDLTLAAAHEGTKITMQNLAALEEDRFDAFPNRVYARAFLRDYANYLGLDSGALLQRYETDWSAGAQATARAKRTGRPIAATIGVAAILIVAVGGASFLYYAHKVGWIAPRGNHGVSVGNNQRQEPVEPTPTATPTATTTAQTTATATAQTTATATATTTPTATATATTTARPVVPPVTGTSTTGTKPAATGTSTATVTIPPIPPVPQGQVKVSLTAVGQAVWISVTTDASKRSTSMTLPANSTASFVGKKVKVRAGKPGFLDVAVNGKKYGKFGKLKEWGKNRTFTPAVPFEP